MSLLLLDTNNSVHHQRIIQHAGSGSSKHKRLELIAETKAKHNKFWKLEMLITLSFKQGDHSVYTRLGYKKNSYHINYVNHIASFK